MSRRSSLLLTALLLALVLLSLAAPWTMLAELLEQDRGLGLAVLVELRLPRALLALTYGAMLGASGAAIQALFANPLASPDLTGTTSGAALGAVVTAYIFGFATPLVVPVRSGEASGLANSAWIAAPEAPSIAP